MPQFFIKIFKIVLWVLIPTLFISGTKVEVSLPSEVFNTRDYIMQITGNLNSSMSGKVHFETSTVTTNKGIMFSTLKIKLDNEEQLKGHSIEFLIAAENTIDLIPTGTYEIFRKQEGLLNYFDGVFGFANINALGELPLFAQSGEIEIDYLDKNSLRGKLNVTMSNSDGKSVQIKGNFVASK